MTVSKKWEKRAFSVSLKHCLEVREKKAGFQRKTPHHLAIKGKAGWVLHRVRSWPKMKGASWVGDGLGRATALL